MSTHNHAIIWIDHREARIFHFNRIEADSQVLHPHNPHTHIHHKANSIGSGHAAEDQAFFRDIAAAIGGVQAFLVTGPANAKTEFVKHLHRHNHDLIEKLAGVETVDHPSDGQLLDYARRYFKAADLMTPQQP
jgi:stalled ribosome rescue protein Dom34